MWYLRNQYASLLQNHQRLRQEYQKLLSVTSELTAGLETVAMSKPGNTQPIDWKKVTNCRYFIKNLIKQFVLQDPDEVCGAVPGAVQE